MKKLLVLNLVFASALFVSCGDDKEEEEEKEESSICSCANLFEKIDKEIKSTEDFEEIQKKYASDIRACDKIQDEMGNEKFFEEMQNCK